ncbi:MAG: hypothetical protein WCF16_02220 [Alphaproteobacteria bacterium]
MTTTKKNQPFDPFSALADLSSLPISTVRQADGLLRAQAEILNGIEAMMSDWVKRRRQGNDAAIQAVEKMCACKDVNDMLVAYCDWLGGSVRRLSEDTAALSEKCVSLAGQAMSAGQLAATEGAKPAAKAKPRRAAKAPTQEKQRAPEKVEKIEKIEKIVKTGHAA